MKKRDRILVAKGRVACLGKAIGRVKIVFSKDEIYRVREGNILVTKMTRPDYVLAMRRAGAIVTDEGGITCHAAIISRELNVPCIVGTGCATRIFKDGDLVQVDAIKGVIEKI